MKKILLIAASFYLLFYPPLLGIHSLRILGLISWVYLGLNYHNLNILYYGRRTISLFLNWCGIIIWLGVIIFLNDQDFGNLAGFIYWIIAVFPVCLMIGAVIKKKNGDIYFLFDVILKAGLVQGILSILTFLLPSIKDFFLKKMVDAGLFELSQYGYYVDLRLFGFSNGLTYAMPVLQAFLAMTALYLAINQKPRYIWYFPILLFSAIVNARTSIVIVIICLFFLFQRNTMTRRKLGKVMMLAVIGCIALALGIVLINKYSPDTLSWVTTGMKQIVGFFAGDNETGYFSYLTDPERWPMPKGFALLFGAGARIMGKNSTGYYTDIGYVNDLWLGGILYCFLSYFFVAICFIYIKRMISAVQNDKSRFIKYLLYSFLLSFFALNIKGYIINLNCFTNLFILFSIFLLLVREQGTSNCINEEYKQEIPGKELELNES